MEPVSSPTRYPEVNALLAELLSSIQEILGPRFIGMYLYGSLATDDFDDNSDIDFLVVTDGALDAELISQLKAMHARIAAGDSHWATDLEGSYIPKDTLRRYSPTNAPYPNLQRGVGETLHLAQHERIVERLVLLERGIVLTGPPVRDLIDPVTPSDLRASVLETFDEWTVPMLAKPAPWDSRGYQSYTVLSLCRMLYTLESGIVTSKQTAACWAKENLPGRWTPLIERAWIGRQNSHLEPEPADMQETFAFMRYALERSSQFKAK